MELILIKLEKTEASLYNKLMNFLSDQGYNPSIYSENLENIIVGNLEIIPSKRKVLVNQREISMTAKEYSILELLASNRGRVFTKEEIYDYIWGMDCIYDNRNIVAYINKIRKKIEMDSSAPDYILTVWGIGYKFNDRIE